MRTPRMAAVQVAWARANRNPSFCCSPSAGTPFGLPCRALLDAQALLGASLRRHRVARAATTLMQANPRQNARLFDKYDANRRALGGEAIDPNEADARTLRALRRALLLADDDDENGSANAVADPGPLLVDVRRVAAMAELYRVLPDEADDPEYAADAASTALVMSGRRRAAGDEGGGSLLYSPPPPPPRSLPDCLTGRDPTVASELDARVRAGVGGLLGVRGAVVRPLDKSGWRRQAAQALAEAAAGDASGLTAPAATAFVLWDVDSAPLPPDADPRAAARLLEAVAAVCGGRRGDDDDEDDNSPSSVRMAAFGTRPALARIPPAFAARYAVEGAHTARSGAATTTAAGATMTASATSLGARCAAYYSSRGLLFEPARGAQPSLKYALRREGLEVVQVGGAKAVTKKKQKSKARGGSTSAAAMPPADALAESAERLLRAHARVRARALFEEEDGGDGRPAAPALLLVVVAGAGELEATGLRRRLLNAAQGAGAAVLPVMVVAGGGGGAAKPSDAVIEVSWEALLRQD